MASDQGPVVQGATMRGTLVRLRKGKNLTQEQVAKRLEWSPSKLIRIEGGRSSVTKVDLDALLTLYELPSEAEREHLQTLNRGAREKAWWDGYRGDISAPYLNYVGYEAGASFIRQFVANAVPGLLQTAEYAEVLTADSVEPIRVAPVVKLRLQRQTELARRADRPWQYYVMDEAVTRRHVGVTIDPAIMPAQLNYMADRAEEDDRLTIRIIPFSAGAHKGMGVAGSFTLLEFGGGVPDLVYLDAGRGDLAIITGDDPEVFEYRDLFESILTPALPEEESIEFLRSAAADLSLSTNESHLPEATGPSIAAATSQATFCIWSNNIARLPHSAVGGQSFTTYNLQRMPARLRVCAVLSPQGERSRLIAGTGVTRLCEWRIAGWVYARNGTRIFGGRAVTAQTKATASK